GEPRLQRSPHRVRLSGVVPHVDVRVIEGFFYGDAAFGINDQHFGQQVPCLTCCDGNRGRAVLLWKQGNDIASLKSSLWKRIYFPLRV
uniref:Uncharacterized protein n=1 Tax=Gasterosteus aculeatus TaxID=69293 RepID=G3Q1Y3_GASAC